ncbi:hypothetical protein CERSUDRAFT_76693 [Gelatoporia subvermispora B]|uniref:Uncharacterized protein n=1 Tax=Ceriporiopsis subvermispora (strain B) TaxID=914234 RepID=M2R3J2_CERS8|nr:hypothetical protein CERSUDRAFT_76693 [Gelatoporia subvermispora B]
MTDPAALPRSRSQPDIPRTVSKRFFRSQTIQRDPGTVSELKKSAESPGLSDAPNISDAEGFQSQDQCEFVKLPPPSRLAAPKRSLSLHSMHSGTYRPRTTPISRIPRRQDQEKIPPLPPFPPSVARITKDIISTPLPIRSTSPSPGSGRGLKEQLDDAKYDLRQTAALLAQERSAKYDLRQTAALLAQERSAKSDILRALMTLQDENHEQAAGLQAAEANVQSFQVQLRSERDARAELNACFNEEKMTLARERDALREERDTLLTKIQEAGAQLEQAREEFKAETELERGQRFRFEAMVQEQVETMVKEARALENELAEKQERLSRAEAEKGTLVKERDDTKLKYDAMAADRDALSVMCKAITAQFQALQRENQELRAALAIPKDASSPRTPEMPQLARTATSFKCSETSGGDVTNASIRTPCKKVSPEKIKGGLSFFGGRRLDSMRWKVSR